MAYQFDFSLVLPCFNESEHFNQSVNRIINVLDGSSFSWEIIFIEDASTDRTSNLIRSYIKKNPRKHLSVYFHDKNSGRGRSVSEGIEKSQGKVVGYIDIDCEIPPEYIPRFISEINSGFDVASGWRIYDFTLKSLPRWFASKGYGSVRNLVLGEIFKDTEAGYKFFDRDKILPVVRKCYSPGWFWDTEIMVKASRAKLRITEIPVVFIRRYDKTSTVKLIPDTLIYLKELWNFNRKPPNF
ncbi:glycosyltransferase [Candidatus Collierbacteria bacterium]|nr:glycosyltransferase [Candidatus Collierbacteria bacterium]